MYQRQDPSPPRVEALDHRDLNRDMGVFAGDPLAGSGLPLWLPAGAAIREEIQRLAKDLARADGCVDVYSPVLGKRRLFERSGHLAKFADDMFPPGRVRQINLDDTHVFCRPDQAAAEAARGLRAALEAQRVLGLPVDHVRLSMRDGSDGWLGTLHQWEKAQRDLRAVAEAVLAEYDLSLVEAPGEAAFYGPKLDLQVRDVRGHEESIATVQLDFNQPEQFDLCYVGPDGEPHRVVMIHRGAVGSMERVVAALLEHYQGRLPLWLAPVQVAVLPVAPAHDGPARALADQLRAHGLRSLVHHDGSLGSRIRQSRLQRAHLIAVIGDREVADGSVQVHDVAPAARYSLGREELVGRLARAHRERQPRLDPVA